jgi:tRNA modification GTPase
MSTAASETECRPTFVVELTPPGRAAVAVVLIAGPAATRIVSRSFRAASGRELSCLPLQRIVFGRWIGGSGEELVVCRRSDERIEVHCHGGLAAASAVMELLIGQGCRRISWSQWLREIANDPIRTDAQLALAEAATARTAAILLDQYHGALTAAIQTAIGAVVFADWDRAATNLDAVLAFRELGMHLTSPWRVVLTGHINVGKSSLMNALAGFQRSIVSRQPGTTRDVVTLSTAIDGWPVQFADTAGLRDTNDELESAGVKLALRSVATADMVIAISDATAWRDQPEESGQHISARLSQSKPGPRVIHVWNKVDLLSSAEREDATNASKVPGYVAPPNVVTSALTGEGIAELVSAIGQMLVPHIPNPGSAVPFLLDRPSYDPGCGAQCNRRPRPTLGDIRAAIIAGSGFIILSRSLTARRERNMKHSFEQSVVNLYRLCR